MNANDKVWLLVDGRNDADLVAYVLQLTQKLLESKVKVKVIFLSCYQQKKYSQLCQQLNINSQFCQHGVFSFLAACYQKQPHLIHSVGHKANILSRLVSFISEFHLISSYYHVEHANKKCHVSDYLDRKTSLLSDSILVFSEADKRRLPVNALQFNYFVNTHKPHLRGKDIAFIGELDKYHGINDFVKLALQFPKQKFHVFGDGPLLSALTKTIGKNIIFHGDPVSMEGNWSMIGLLIIPIKSQHLPINAIMAMSLGIPVAGYQVGFLSELINNKTGWLSPVGDLTSLQYSIDSWLRQSTERSELMAQECQNKVLFEYNAEIIVPKIISLYQQALNLNSQLEDGVIDD